MTLLFHNRFFVFFFCFFFWSTGLKVDIELCNVNSYNEVCPISISFSSENKHTAVMRKNPLVFFFLNLFKRPFERWLKGYRFPQKVSTNLVHCENLKLPVKLKSTPWQIFQIWFLCFTWNKFALPLALQTYLMIMSIQPYIHCACKYARFYVRTSKRKKTKKTNIFYQWYSTDATADVCRLLSSG